MIDSPKKHLYHGDGKGKTTAAVGLSVRAAKYHNRVLFCSFLKDGSSGEMDMLKSLGIDTGSVASPAFTWLLTDSERAALTEKISVFWKNIAEKADNYDLIVLDEILDTINEKLFIEDELVNFLHAHPNIEIVITGRKPSARILEIADYVTEMKMLKHPFTNHTPPREGIEK